MKKTYIQPSINVFRLHVRSCILTTSKLGVGDDISSGSGDSRQMDFNFDGE